MKSRSGFPSPVLSVTLLITWLLLINAINPLSLLSAVFFAWALPLLLRKLRLHNTSLRHPIRLLRFLALVFQDILVANVMVIPLFLGRNERLRPGFVEYPLNLPNDFALSILAGAISLAPGTVSADISADQRTLLIHVLHLEDANELITLIEQRYEKPLREIFEC